MLLTMLISLLASNHRYCHLWLYQVEVKSFHEQYWDITPLCIYILLLIYSEILGLRQFIFFHSLPCNQCAI